MRTKFFMAALLCAIATAALMFQIKYTMVDLETEHRRVLSEIDNEKNLIRTRRADLAFLTRPQRLDRHAAALGLRPAKGSRIITADRIGRRIDVQLAGVKREITLPKGGSGSIAWKPLARFKLDALEERRR